MSGEETGRYSWLYHKGVQCGQVSAQTTHGPGFVHRGIIKLKQVSLKAYVMLHYSIKHHEKILHIQLCGNN